MTLGSFVRWAVLDRARCTLYGHRWTPKKVGSRYGLVDGYECERCSKSRTCLFIWENDPVEEGSES